MSIEVHFYLKKKDETIPLQIEQPSVMVKQLLKEGVAKYEASLYTYKHLQINNQKVNIYVSKDRE